MPNRTSCVPAMLAVLFIALTPRAGGAEIRGRRLRREDRTPQRPRGATGITAWIVRQTAAAGS